MTLGEAFFFAFNVFAAWAVLSWAVWGVVRWLLEDDDEL